MKPYCLSLAAGLCLFFWSCQKTDLEQQLPAGQDTPTTAQRSATHPKNLVLQSFSWNNGLNSNREYRFYYAPNGQVDSIVVSGNPSYVYRVAYKGSRIDSVSLVLNGQAVSTNRDFEYKGSLITGYNNFVRATNNPYPTSYSFTYDKKKRLQQIQRSFRGSVFETQQLAYDNFNNVATWSRSGNAGTTTTSYTYDAQLNPLYLVPDLFALLVEETGYWELIFSEHNMVTKTSPGGSTAVHQNQYNVQGQLVTKRITAPSTIPTTYTFTYL